ncbi:putative transport protein [Cystobacter fuscus DSM 2262]|uniref:Transport protein n=1 Tax=Cystobacter fuscus (strain ATCC 25194 / DSM 2262 / NBRC 100088 / M29) TaxID=1242864 RepID=S9QGL9_CYSF2|nr:MFS transporter [Cystobacter fuscus]EPX60464.1 putative transport protein [Cystobacter fuscus DSM 2262]
MPPPSPPLAPGRLRAARAAVAALFLTNGAIFANLLPRYPQLKADLGLSNAEYGLAVAAFPCGALMAGLAAGALIRRFRSSRVAVAGTLLTSAGVLLAGSAPSWGVLAGALFFGGCMDAITDVAQNSHGLRVQRLHGRSILNSFHAIWSIGAVTGGLMGGLAAGLDVPRGVHLGISALLFAVVALTALRFTLPGPEPIEPDERTEEAARADGSPTRRGAMSPGRIWLMIAALVLIAIGGTLVEDAGSTWAAVYLSGTLGADVAVASFGFIALVGAQFIGRMLGDGLVDRFGQRAVARAGGATTAAGMGAALLFPSVPGTIAGFALAGFGVATLVPAAMHGADELPGLRAGTGLTVVSWLMRLGFLLSPPIVGLVADAVGLRVGLLVVPLAGTLVLVLSGVLSAVRIRAGDPHPGGVPGRVSENS